MAFQRGDVVLVPFPFSDLSTTKGEASCGGEQFTLPCYRTRPDSGSDHLQGCCVQWAFGLRIA
jgi:hypothetical protein